MSPPSTPYHPQNKDPPVLTTSKQPRPPDYAPSSCRGLESAALQYIVQPCSASLKYGPRFPRSSPPPLLSPAAGSPLLLSPRVSLYYLLCKIVLETSQGPSHARGKHPNLRPKTQHRLYHRLEKHPRDPQVGHLLYQNTCQPCPTLPRLLHVPHYLWPVVFHCRQNPPNSFKRGNSIEQSPIGLKVPLRDLLNLLFRHLLAFLLLSLVALSGGNMPPAQRSPGHNYVAPGAQCVAEVSLLQYNHSVPEMPVEKIGPHLRLRCLLSPIPLDKVVPRSFGGWEVHIIGAWLSTGGHGPSMPYPYP